VLEKEPSVVRVHGLDRVPVLVHAQLRTPAGAVDAGVLQRPIEQQLLQGVWIHTSDAMPDGPASSRALPQKAMNNG
jgi:hypothetical protein